MLSWSEVQAHLRRARALECDEPTWLGFASSGPNGRVRTAVALCAQAARPTLHATSAVAHRGAIDPEAALRYNASATAGALVLDAGTYELRRVFPLDDLSLPGLELALDELAAETARLRAEHATLRETSGTHRPHAHFSE
jgi:hypothetical protein